MTLLSLCAVLACSAVAAPTPAAAGVTVVAAVSKSSSTDSKARRSYRQFTGIVTALDKNSITVEKSGKKAKTMTFARHAEMRTTGDLDKDVRVTIYYRDEDGQSVAHRVVVKPEKSSTAVGG